MEFYDFSRHLSRAIRSNLASYKLYNPARSSHRIAEALTVYIVTDLGE